MAWYQWLNWPIGLNKWLWDKLKPQRPGMPARIPHSAAYGVALPLVYGKTRLTGNLIYFEPATVSGNSGARVLIALCEGPITGVSRIWRDSDVRTLEEWGLAVRTGTRPTQTTYESLPAGKDIGYPGVAFVHPPPGYIISEWGLGWIGQASYEVQGMSYASGDATNGDADPSLILNSGFSFLSDSNWGAGAPFGIGTGTGRDGSANSSYARYVKAESFWLSPAFTEQKPTTQHLQEVLDASNATCLWTSGILEIVPLGDQSVTGNSVTYTPANAIQYALTKDDFLARDDGSRIEIALAPETGTYNLAPVEFLDRIPAAATADPAHAYNVAVEEDPDPVDVFSVRGERRAPIIQLHAICQRSIALRISRIRAQRMMGARNLYKFALPWRFCRLQPLDFVTLTDELLGLAAVPVRIESIKEDPKTRELKVEALDWPAGTSSAVVHATSSSDAAAPGVETYQTERRLHEIACSQLVAASGPAGTNNYLAVAFGGGVVCAVGNDGGLGGKCSTSADGGITYTARTIPVRAGAIVWDPNHSTFVAVGPLTAGATSPTGTTWTDRSAALPAGNYASIATDGAGLVVAVGADLSGNGVCATSTDGGATWTVRTMPAGFWQAVLWTGSGFVAVGIASGSSNLCATSTANGQTWTARTIPTGGYRALSRAASGRIVAVGDSGVCSTSNDSGVTWTARTAVATGGAQLSAITFSGRILVTNDNTKTYTSEFGETWIQRAPAVSAGVGGLRGLAIAERRLVQVGGSSYLAYSSEF